MLAYSSVQMLMRLMSLRYWQSSSKSLSSKLHSIASLPPRVDFELYHYEIRFATGHFNSCSALFKIVIYLIFPAEIGSMIFAIALNFFLGFHHLHITNLLDQRRERKTISDMNLKNIPCIVRNHLIDNEMKVTPDMKANMVMQGTNIGSKHNCGMC